MNTKPCMAARIAGGLIALFVLRGGAALTLQHPVTGSTAYSNTNTVDVASFVPIAGYDLYQINQSTNEAVANAGVWTATNTPPTTVTFAIPDPEGAVTVVAWFKDSNDVLPLTNATTTITYVRQTADVSASAVGQFTAPTWGASHPAVARLVDIDIGSSSSIGLFSRTLAVTPAVDQTPGDPTIVTVTAADTYSVTLTVTDRAGNSVSDTNIVWLVVAGDTAQQTTWTGSAGTSDWFTHGNWSAYAPGPGAEATINAGTVTLNASTAPLAAFTLNGGTLTFSGWETVLNATDITVDATVTHLPQSATAVDSLSGQWVPDNRVQLVCSNLVVTADGIINANAKGYGGGGKFEDGYGPGGGRFVGKGISWGGAYGGAGGLATTEKRYGSVDAPIDPGSGGGPWTGFVPSRGGGAIRIAASGMVVVEGTVTADGGAAPAAYGAGGSGGSIYISCRTFTSSNGTLSVSGKYALNAATPGNGGGGGGGGRIALVYDVTAQAAQNLTAKPVVKIVAAEGIGSVVFPYARPGTIYLSDSSFFPASELWGGVLLIPAFDSWTTASLTVSGGLMVFTNDFQLTVLGDLLVRDNGGMEFEGGTIRVDGDLRFANNNSDYGLSWFWLAAGDSFTVGSDLVVGKSHLRWYGRDSALSTITIGGDLVMTNQAHFSLYSGTTNAAGPDHGALVTVGKTVTLGGSSWIYPYSAPANGGSPLLRMETLQTAPGTGFNADSKGYPGTGTTTLGPGGGASIGKTGHGGGGYGGAGGNGANNCRGGIAYGSETRPLDPGSAGGAWSLPVYKGGAGGGLIRLEIAKKATLNGTLDADGYNITDYGAGGAGGGIYLTCATLLGEGAIITAKGGTGRPGTGGGGGGGRIALWSVANKANTDDWTISVAGGTGYNDGDIGTIYWGKLPAAGTILAIR